MQSLHPNPGTVPLVPLQCFNVPESFMEDLLTAIRIKLKAKKAPGPDTTQPEVFRVAPELFAEAAFELWRAVERIGKVPSVIHSGLLSPIYKRKGDPLDPTNNIPVCLTTAHRWMITTAITSGSGVTTERRRKSSRVFNTEKTQNLWSRLQST